MLCDLGNARACGSRMGRETDTYAFFVYMFETNNETSCRLWVFVGLIILLVMEHYAHLFYKSIIVFLCCLFASTSTMAVSLSIGETTVLTIGNVKNSHIRIYPLWIIGSPDVLQIVSGQNTNTIRVQAIGRGECMVRCDYYEEKEYEYGIYKGWTVDGSGKSQSWTITVSGDNYSDNDNSSGQNGDNNIDGKISIFPTKMSVDEGNTFSIIAECSGDIQFASPTTWSSSNSNIVEFVGIVYDNIDSKAQFKAKQKGVANIIATRGGKSASTTVTVNKTSATYLTSLLLQNANLENGDHIALSVSKTPNNAVDNLVWESDNENVAIVDDDGVVYGVNVGTAHITVSSDFNSSIRATCLVTVTKHQLLLYATSLSNSFYYGNDFEIELLSDRNDANIYYTVDGTEPTTSSLQYHEKIVINKSVTLKAKALKNDYYPSATLLQQYTAKLKVETDVNSGKVLSGQKITLSSSCNDAKIYYTLDGSIPTIYSKRYTDPITISGATILKAIAMYDGCESSDVIERHYYLYEEGETFVGRSIENAELIFQVISNEEMTCRVGDNSSYAIDKNTEFEQITIPQVVNEYRVTQIGKRAFSTCDNIKGISIPNSINSINQSAFQGCDGLTNIVIPEGVTTIGTSAFQNCRNIVSISIPKSVTSIGNYSFYGCENVNEIYSYIETPFDVADYTFYYYNNTYNNYKILPATLYIPCETKDKYKAAKGWRLFPNNQIVEMSYNEGDSFTICQESGESMTFVVLNASEKTLSLTETTLNKNSTTFNIPETVRGYRVVEIGDYAFGYVQFADMNPLVVNIPSSIKRIGKMSFYGANISQIDIPESVECIDDYAFLGGIYSTLTSLRIPSSVKSIGYNIVIENSVISTITVDNNNMVYDSRDNCNAIIESATNTLIVGCNGTTIPQSVKTIGCEAFRGCENLKSITLSENLTSIEEYAFYDCVGLTSIISEIKDPFAVDKSAFQYYSLYRGDVPLTATLYVPKGTKYKYETTDGWKEFKNIVEMEPVDPSVFTAESENGVTMTFKIIDEANKTCQIGTGISAAIPASTNERVILPMTVNGYTVTAIAANAFAATNISEVYIPNTIKGIGENAFVGCNVLNKVIVHDIAAWCDIEFSNSNSPLSLACHLYSDENTEIKDLIIPNSVTSIGANTFRYCSGLTSVTIPTSVTSIGSYAFSGCDNLTSVTVGWDEPISIGTNCFSNAADATLYVPIGTNYNYSIAAGWKNFGQIANSTNSTITADDVIVCRGGQLTLPIILSNDEDIRSLQFELVLPEGVSVVTSNGNPLASLTSRASSTHMITGLSLSNGNYQFQIMSKTFSDDIIQGNDGRIATITLKVPLNVIPDDYEIRITDGELDVDGESQSLLLPDTNSKLTVSGVLLGDTQDDKRVSVKDISNIIDYILHKNVQDFVWHAANASGDDRISVTDISTIIDIILHKTVFGEKQATKIEELDPQ